MKKSTYKRLAGLTLGITFSIVAYAQTPIGDPIPDVVPGNLNVQLNKWAELPHSSSRKPWARINMMRELPDGSDRMAVNDLNGPFYLIDKNNPTLTYEYLDFNDELKGKFRSSNGKGTGFGGFAFHPEFGTNGIFFTTHAEHVGSGSADYNPLQGGTDVEWVLTKWTATDPSSNTFAGTHEQLVRWDFPTSIHGAQEISFNPYAEKGDADYGMLYICLGEGGSSGRRLHGNMQTLESFMGSIWRIDPLGNNSPNGKYGIPADNPFVGVDKAVEEIWAYGFRNPHRIEFDMRDGEVILFAGDIGEHNIEEINLIEKGGNYGWNNREGSFYFDKNGNHGTVYELPAQDDEDYIYPVAQFDHGDGAAMALGHVWRSERMTRLNGILFSGDILTGRAFYAPVDSLIQGRQYQLQEVNTYNSGEALDIEGITELDGSSPRVDLKYGYDLDGEVYVVTKADGRIRMMGEIAKSSAKDILNFRFSSQVGGAQVDNGNRTITLGVDSDADLAKLIASFEISEGATLVLDGKVQNSGSTAMDFSNGSITFTVIAEDESEQEWTVVVNVVLKTENDITSFSFEEQMEEAVIDEANHVINVTVKSGTDLTSLIPNFELSEKASVKVGSNEPVSGQTSFDFTNGTVTFTVVAEDGTEQEWTVNVEEYVLSNELESQISLYPTKASDEITIEAASTGTLIVMNLDGKVMMKSNLSKSLNRINISTLNSGLYLAQIHQDKGSVIKRFVKQ